MLFLFIPGTVTSFFSSYHHILHYISHANTTRKLWQQSLGTLFNFNQILQCHYSVHQHLLNFHKTLRPYLYRFSIPTYYNLLVLMSLEQKFTHHKKIRNRLLFYMRFSFDDIVKVNHLKAETHSQMLKQISKTIENSGGQKKLSIFCLIT